MAPDAPNSAPHHLPPGWLGEADNKRRVLAELAARRTRRRTRTILSVVGAAAALAVAGTLWRPMTSPRAAIAQAEAPRRETLPDGSVIEARGDAAYAVRFDGAARRIALERGTAYFDVAKDAARPFIVTAAGVEVRAVGTAFSVEVGRAAVEVLVTEGRVAVAPPAAAPESAVAAGAGVRVALETPGIAAAPVQSVAAAELEEKLAWRVRLVEFSGTPLAEAIAVLNSHNRIRFVLADPALAAVKLSGVFRADRVAGVVRLLEDECGVRVERRGDTELVLHRAR